MFIEEILKYQSNTPVEGTYVISDLKLKPFNDKPGYFLTFSLQDKTGVVWSKIWDNGEQVSQALKDVSVVTVKGRSNLYHDKVQLIVDKIKVADENSYELKDLIKISSDSPEKMWNELKNIITSNLIDDDYKVIWKKFEESEIIEVFKLWPGGKGTVHHAYQHGLLEHTLSVVSLVQVLSQNLNVSLDLDKAIIGALFHDIGKLDAYKYDKLKIEMSNAGRLHDHTILGYYLFRKFINDCCRLDISNKQLIEEDVGHIILSHHGQFAQIKPMTIEAKIVSIADCMDADANYIENLSRTVDEQGWIFDSLASQFYFKRPKLFTKRGKLIKEIRPRASQPE